MLFNQFFALAGLMGAALAMPVETIGSATGKIVRRQTCEISLSYGYGCLTAPDNGNVNMVEEVGKVESAAIDV